MSHVETSTELQRRLSQCYMNPMCVHVHASIVAHGLTVTLTVCPVH